MSLTILTCNLRLVIEGPVLTRSTTASARGVDCAMLRDLQGNPIVPDSLLTGRLREVLCRIRAACLKRGDEALADYFDPIALFGASSSGSGGAETDSFRPARKGVVLADAVLQPPGTAASIRHLHTRIEIEDDTGTARQGHLRVAESPVPPRTAATFRAKGIRIIATSADHADRMLQVLRTALAGLRVAGADTNSGFGRVLSAELSDVAPVPPATISVARGNTSVALALLFSKPLLVGEGPMRNNTFQSAEHISGRVLKGAIADAARLAGLEPDPKAVRGTGKASDVAAAFANLFTRLEVSQAVPISASRERFVLPRTPPRTLAVASEGDGALVAFDTIFAHHRKGADQRFSIDWKRRHEKVVQQQQPQYAREPLPRQLRVRTAIASATGRAAESQLFGYGMVGASPDESALEAPVEWITKLQLPDDIVLTDRDAFWKLLFGRVLHVGLPRLGKTKAGASLRDVSLLMADSADAQLLQKEFTQIALCLNSSALIVGDTRCLSARTTSAMLAFYQSYWHEVSAGALILTRHAATQSLAGGNYLAQLHSGTRMQAYLPFYLTQPGSVFELTLARGKEEQATDLLSRWLKHGLPLGTYAETEYGLGKARSEHWRHCPFTPENGHGDVYLLAVQ